MAKNVKNSKFACMMFIITLLFFYLPLMVLIVFSFNQSKAGIRWEAFSFKWYQELFLNSDKIWAGFRKSILIAVISASTSTIIGTLGAIGMYLYNFKIKKYLQVISYMPLIIPDIIMGISLLLFFVNVKWQLGMTTIFISHTTFNLSFVILIILARMDEFDKSILEAAYDLGATEMQALMRVIVPMTIPGMLAGFLMAMTLSLDDFVITFFVSGPGSSTLPLEIYSMIRFGVSPVINAISVLLIGITLIFVFSTTNLRKYMIK